MSDTITVGSVAVADDGTYTLTPNADAAAPRLFVGRLQQFHPSWLTTPPTAPSDIDGMKGAAKEANSYASWLGGGLNGGVDISGHDVEIIAHGTLHSDASATVALDGDVSIGGDLEVAGDLAVTGPATFSAATFSAIAGTIADSSTSTRTASTTQSGNGAWRGLRRQVDSNTAAHSISPWRADVWVYPPQPAADIDVTLNSAPADGIVTRFYRVDPTSGIVHRVRLLDVHGALVALLDQATYGTSLNWCDVVSVGDSYERGGAGGDSY